MPVRFPHENYVFKYENYGSFDHPYNDDYKKAADEIRSVYPELQNWPNWACVVAYMSYGEDIHYCGNPYDGESRKEEFLAYLYAEQELDDNGFFIREDGSPFTHYDLDGLDRIWAVYDKEKLNME